MSRARWTAGRDELRIAAAIRPVVRRAGLDAAAAPARHAGRRARRRERAADRADRWRQDAGRVPADPGGVGRDAAHRAAHAVCQSAEGARHRHRAQPDPAGGRDAAAGVDRDPHRRHAGQPPRPPARLAAEHPADHAGEPGGAAVAAGRAGDVRRSGQRGDGRGACARRHQARRSAGAVRRAADDAGARLSPRRSVGDGGASGRDPSLCRRRAGDRGAGRHAARS